MALMLVFGTAYSHAAENRYQNFSYLVMSNQEFEQWFNGLLSGTAISQDEAMFPVSIQGGTPVQGHIEKMSYIFGAGDVISVKVQGKPELSRDSIRVNTDGWISLPLVGEIQVIDRDKDEVLLEITEMFKEYLIEPSVSLVIEKPRTQYTYVLGAVKNPGPFRHIEKIKEDVDQKSHEVYFNYDYHLTSALESAGGLSEDADLKNVHVFNEKLGYHRRVDLFSLIVLGKVEQDITMRPGDVIYVPRVEVQGPMDDNLTKLIANSKIGAKFFPVKVYGYVRKPDLYQLSAQEMTLQSALAKAGGPMAEIASDKVVVARVMADGKLNKIVVDSGDEDFLLRPNDVLMVTQTSLVHKIDAIVETLSNVLFRSSFTLKNADEVMSIF